MIPKIYGQSSTNYKTTIEKLIQTFVGGIVTYQTSNTDYPNEVCSTTFFFTGNLVKIRRKAGD